MSSTTATTTFFDNFNTLSLWNGSSGTWNTNFWYNPLNGNGGSLPSNGEQEWYINANDPATSSVVPWTVNDGIMTITANKASSSIQSLINNYQYTSGELNTYHSFSQTYGYFDMRAELPAGQGLWPAFWMIPENGQWPPEIDIMEQLGNNPSVYYTSVHSGTSSAEVNAGQGNTVANTSTAYHDYAVSWTPTTLTYYYDGKAVYSTATPSDMNIPMYLELNLAVGGGWPGSPNSTTPFPAQYKVAYVDVYASNPTGNLPTTTFTANNTPGQVLLGAAGIDVFNAGTSSVTMTGDGEINTYNWNAMPTAAARIMDFDPATDVINLGGLLHSVGYTGSNPFGDGTLSLVSDGNGGTNVQYKGQTIVDLVSVQASSISTSSDFVTTYSGSGSTGTGSTGTGSTGTGSTGTGSTGTGSTGTGSTGTGSTGTGSTGTGSTGTGSTGTGSTGTGSTGTGSTGTGTTGTGATLSANSTAGQILKATSPSTTFNAGQNSVVMTEDGGNNTFVYSALPYNAGQITNFNPANDKIDVSAILKAAGYTGTSPFSDGTLTLSSDGHGGTDLVYHPPGAGSNGVWPITIVDIDNVLPSALNTANDFITGTSSTGTGSTGTGSTGTGSTGTGTGSTGTGSTGTGSTGTGSTGTGSTGTGSTGTGSTGTGSTGTGSTGTGSTGTGSTGTGSTGTGTGTSDPTLTANNTAGQILKATAPNTVFNAGQNSVVMTEDGGNNTFVYKALPYNAGQITNFNPANDKIDVSAMLTAAGYKGANPFGDGTLTLSSDGHGGTDLIYHPAGAGSNGIWPITVVDIDNVAASALSVANDFITSATSSTGTGSTGTGTAADTGSTGTGSTGTGTTGTGSTGTGSTGTGTSTAGETLTANNTAHQVLTGTTGNDIFNAGQNSVVMTGDGGADTFVFSALPYNAGQITDFNPSTDKIDVHTMLSAAGYTGSNPFGDGTLTLTSDHHGGTDLMYNPPGAGSNGHWSTTVVDIANVAPSAITASDFITSATGMSTPSGTAAPTTTTSSSSVVTGTGSTGTTASTSATPGITLTANDTAGQVLTGTAGNDTFNAGHNSVVMTGNGGADTFVFNYQPWNAGHITDFNTAMDTINVSGLLSAAGYTGTNPLGDGTLSLSSDGNGGTNLYYHQTSNSIAIKIVDIDHVAPSSIHASDFILH